MQDLALIRSDLFLIQSQLSNKLCPDQSIRLRIAIEKKTFVSKYKRHLIIISKWRCKAHLISTFSFKIAWGRMKALFPPFLLYVFLWESVALQFQSQKSFHQPHFIICLFAKTEDSTGYTSSPLKTICQAYLVWAWLRASVVEMISIFVPKKVLEPLATEMPLAGSL